MPIPTLQLDGFRCELASRNLWQYCKLKAPDFYRDDCVYLKEVCDAIQAFETDDTEVLVINMPPRHGKSRTACLAVQWLLGRDKSTKIMTASYNETLSREFSKAARNDISERKADADRIIFSDVFPDVKLQRGSSSVDLWRLEGNSTNNYLATSPTATMTGFGCDFLIIDDLVKSAYEANNRNILDAHFKWFTDTALSRQEGKCKLLLIMTRWATKDLAGRIIPMYQEQGAKVKVITKKAFDGTKMLNERITSKARYERLMQTVGEDIVRANYDQEPIDLKGALYGAFKTYTDKPQFVRIEARCDTADKGTDYLCLIIYGITADGNAYVLDVYYTKDNFDITELEIPRRLKAFAVNRAVFESNFGGRPFANTIRRNSQDIGNVITSIGTFEQTLNKEARILTHSTNVTNRIIMPHDWAQRWPIFHQDVTGFQRAGKNANDDAPDTLTMIAETLKTATNLMDALGWGQFYK